MIWGMTLEPGKLYTEIMGEEVQLSLAAIDSRKDTGESSSNSFCQIVMKTSKGEYVLCTLVHGVMFQQNLDLKIMPREKVTFSVQGSSVVYLVGYTASYPEDEDEFGDMREDDLEESEDSSAWEAFETDPSQIDHIKEEPIDVPEDSPSQQEPPEPEEGEAPSRQPQPSAEPMEGGGNGGEEPEEVIFSIPDLEGEVKTEAPDHKATPDQTLPPEMTSQEDVYGAAPTDQGTGLPQTSTDQDYFYPETQQQPEVALTPLPTTYQPPNTAPVYPQATPQGVMPPSEQFLPPQAPMQPSQAGPIRHSVGRGAAHPANAQRNYPPQRRQYAANRGRGAKSRSAPQPINVQHVRNVQQQQSMPGPSQRGDVPGPSASGPLIAQTTNRTADQAIPATPSQDPPVGRYSSSVQQSPLDDARFCSYCGKGFATVNKRKIHERVHVHRHRYSCPYCPRGFALLGDFKRHERIHTGERPFKCSYCPKDFHRVAALRDHEMIHTGQKPHKCSVCGQAFIRKQTMKKHEERVHNLSL